MRSAIRISPAAILLALVVCVPALAQDRNAAFFHGFGAEAGDWAPTASRLADRVAILPRLPEFSWRQSFPNQANEVQASWWWLPNDSIAVGHSNGGVLSREWSRQHGLDGIITIGTPHRGAPVIPHFSQYSAFHGATSAILNRILSAFSQSSPLNWIYWYLENTMHWTSDFSGWSVYYLGLTLGLDAAVPVAYDMIPDSPYLSGLNSSFNLNREAAAVPSRVGIVSVAHNFYWAGPARAIAPNDADQIADFLYGSAYGLLYWSGFIFAYADPSDFAAFEQAASINNLADHLLQIDPVYCRTISRIDGSDCLANDGLVPDESQIFPNAPNLLIGQNNDGPAHTQEKQLSDDAFYDAFAWYMHVPPRGAAPPPPPPPPGPPPPPNPDPDPNPAPGPAAGGSQPDVVASGRELHPGETVHSANGLFHLSFQGDGNLVLYDQGWWPLWESGTAGMPAGVAAMQGDGNFVIYTPDGMPIWDSSSSYGHPGSVLVVQNDGNVVIYDGPTPVWATNTVQW